MERLTPRVTVSDQIADIYKRLRQLTGYVTSGLTDVTDIVVPPSPGPEPGGGGGDTTPTTWPYGTGEYGQHTYGGAES